MRHSTGKQNPNTDNAQLTSATVGFGFSPRFQLMVQPFLAFFARVYLRPCPNPDADGGLLQAASFEDRNKKTYKYKKNLDKGKDIRYT